MFIVQMELMVGTPCFPVSPRMPSCSSGTPLQYVGLRGQSPRLRSCLQQGLDGPDGYAGSDMARREVQQPPPGEHRRVALLGVALEAGAADVPPT